MKSAGFTGSLLIGALLSAGCGAPAADERPGEAAQAAAAGPMLDPGTYTWQGSRWTNGEIPFVIDRWGFWFHPNNCSFEAVMNLDQVDAIYDSIEQIEALSPVDFVEVTSPPPGGEPYLIYRGSIEGAWADTRGMEAPNKTDCVYIPPVVTPDDEGRRIVMHETLHAVGFDHEQQRTDRDDYLEVDETCMTGDVDKLWKIDPDSLLLTPYDSKSIMQYHSDNGCSDSCKVNGVCQNPLLLLKDTTCTPQSDPAVPWSPGYAGDCRWIYKNTHLSIHDVNAMWRMYERAIGVNQAADQFGAAFAAGDFDDDGYTDLAVGSPGNNAVFVWKGTGGEDIGSLGRLVAWRVLRPTDVGGSYTFSYGQFGAALAAGDFDGDGVTDLAVGAPGQNGGGAGDGSVFVYWSQVVPDSERRTLAFQRLINQYYVGLGTGALGDQLGAALAAGDFDNDGTDDLAIGVPKKVVGTATSGEVLVIYSHNPDYAHVLTAASVTGGVNRTGARFGAALATADLDIESNAVDDLVVGSPEPQTLQPPRTGAAYLFKGIATSNLVGKQILRPSDTGIMRFGAALAVGNFTNRYTPTTNKPESQLAIGAPNRTNGTVVNAGAVYVFVPPASSATINYTELTRVVRPAPSANDQLGNVVIAWPTTAGSADRIAAGLPNAGVGRVLAFTSLNTNGTQWSIGQLLNPAQTTGDGFGAALVLGNFRPMLDGDPGAVELVAGAPTYGGPDGAGTMWVYNADPSDGVPWLRIDQESVIHE